MMNYLIYISLIFLLITNLTMLGVLSKMQEAAGMNIDLFLIGGRCAGTVEKLVIDNV